MREQRLRSLLVINANLDPALKVAVAEGRYPRKDFLELQRVLEADIIDLAAIEQGIWGRLARRIGGRAFAQAVLALLRAKHYDAIFVDRESAGFALAALCKLRSRRPRLVMIGHLLSSRKKQLAFHALRLRHTIDHMIVHSSLQQRLACDSLGLRPDQVALLPYQTDERFWSPVEQSPKRQICSVGLEYRDYATLIEAVRGLNVQVVVAAASHWSHHQGLGSGADLPANVQVTCLDYAALRQLYAESLFVVVPLHDVENQAGITTILEAMAMGKAVIVSHSLGQTDVVRDRRRQSRVDPSRSTQPNWARLLGASDETAQAHTGIYVQPADPQAMCRAITFLVSHPEEARIMGRNGRRLVEETMGLDHFTARIVALMRGTQTLVARGAIAMA